jgi:monofunctional biosynthetic peptidoglycan transglycosylase
MPILEVEMPTKENQVRGKFQIYLKSKLGRLAYVVLAPYRIFKVVCFSIGFLVLTLALGTGGYLYRVYRSVPDIDQMTFHQLKSRAQQSVFQRLEDRSRLGAFRWTEIHEVNRDFLYTIVMSEDSSFFDHEGLNYDAIMNSLAENIKKKKYEYGASTITQQVVKNLFLTHEKSLIRKLKEWILTEKIERRFTKNQILEAYLNLAEFGPDIFGIDSASRHFFHKAPSQINAAEGAFIALMLPSPRKNYYSIYQNRNLASTKKKKIRRVLGDMLANEFISQKQYQNYIRYKFYRGDR